MKNMKKLFAESETLAVASGVSLTHSLMATLSQVLAAIQASESRLAELHTAEAREAFAPALIAASTAQRAALSPLATAPAEASESRAKHAAADTIRRFVRELSAYYPHQVGGELPSWLQRELYEESEAYYARLFGGIDTLPESFRNWFDTATRSATIPAARAAYTDWLQLEAREDEDGKLHAALVKAYAVLATLQGALRWYGVRTQDLPQIGE